MRCLQYTVETSCDGLEIRQYLRDRKGLSSKLLVKLKKYESGIMKNGVHARTVDRVAAGDVITLELRESPQEFVPLERNIPILYESEDVIVYNKPPLMPCHPSKNHLHDTLANVFSFHCLQKGETAAFRCINRLDRDTSGAVVVAKNRFAAAALTGKVEKVYEALVTGVPDPPSDVIEKPIFRPDPMRTERSADDRGQYAKTEYSILFHSEKYAYVRFRLYTGRTHQIRVHMSWKGWPIVGDDMYGGSRELLSRQALHCAQVSFSDPGNEKTVVVQAPLYRDMERLVQAVKAGNI